MNYTRPDIAYTLCRLSKYTRYPGSKHWEALIRLLQYLRGTMNYGVQYSGFPALLEGYSDCNWISYSDKQNPLMAMSLFLVVVQSNGS